MIHELKIVPKYYERILEGVKNFEVRYNDRGFQPGDTVVLREYVPEPFNSWDLEIQIGYTDREPLEFTIGYVYSLPKDMVVFALLPPPKKKPKQKSKKLL